jgi:hypothetical protein
MQLPNVTTFNPYSIVQYSNSSDMSGSYMPKVTTMSFGGSSSTYQSYNVKSIKLNYITAPNLTSLSALCGYFYVLKNFEARQLPTNKVTNMSYLFYYCRALNSVEISD